MMAQDTQTHAPCPDYPDQWFHKTGGFCSCGGSHSMIPPYRANRCSCAHNTDGSVTTMLCPQHSDQDPCARMAAVTGRRRRGSIVRGVCSACGWTS